MGTVDSVARLLALSAGNGGSEPLSYNDLENKPQINGTTLTGNKTLDELGITAGNLNVYTKEETISAINNVADDKADKTALGNLSDLATDDKSSAVAAINEIKEKGTKASNIDNLTITENENGTIQAVGVLNDKDKETLVKLWTGTKAEYDAIEEKDDVTLYNITDDYEEPEIVANKTTIIDANSTDTQYPSAKAVYDRIKESAPDLSNYVQKTDYATYDNAGVLRANSSGFNVGTDGIPRAEQYDLDNYNKIPNNTFISKGTLENIKDDYVGTSEPINVLNDTLDDVVPKQTATDSIINVNDALKYKTFDFKVDGAYKQTTSDGSNLLNIDYSINPVQGEKGDIQASLNDDYSFTITGQRDNTEYSNIYFNLLTDLNIKQGVQYYTHDLFLVLLDSELNWIKNQSGNFIADGNYIVKRFYWATNKTGSINETIRPYFGTVPYDESKYYKYTGGIASPNPDYSQEITPLSFDKITKIGQNLLPNTFFSKHADYSIDDDGWASVTFNNSGGTSNQYFNLYYDSAKLKPNKNYNVILEVKELSGTGTMVVCSNAIFGEQKEGQFSTDYRLTFSNLQSGKIYNKICLTKTDLDNIVASTRSFVQADPGQAGSITFRISVLEDTTKTPENFVYQPYQETNYQIDLQGNEMVSLPNGVKDELTIDKDGSVNLVKKIGKKTLLDTDVAGIEHEWFSLVSFSNVAKPLDYIGEGTYALDESYNNIVLNRFYQSPDSAPRETYDKVYSIIPYMSGWSFGITFPKNTTIEEAKGMIDGTILYYQLKEPQTISLGKLSDLITTEQGSNTFAINGNIDTNINTTYALDIKKYIDNKIAAISSAVLEQE